MCVYVCGVANAKALPLSASLCLQAVFEIDFFRTNPRPFFLLAKVRCAAYMLCQ